jgi:iron(III) transport system substrate-binding protein
MKIALRWVLGWAAVLALPAAAQTPSLVDAAKKEGTLTFYTTIAEKDLPVIVQPFEKKYGIKVNIWRAGTDKVLQRTIQEARANRNDVDVIHYGSPEMEALAREKILKPVDDPVHKDLMPGSVPAHKQWAATILSVWVQAYNTNTVKKADLPKKWEDLLDPRWKGKIGIEGKNDDWFASVVQLMGEQKGLDFFRKLSETNGVSVRKGHSLLNNLVVSGDVPLALTVYNYMPEQSKQKGAPIDWFVIEPAIARSNAVGVAAKAKHPNAALLFYEYLLGPDGQKAMTSIDYVPTNTKVESPLKGVKIISTDPVRSLDESEKWSKLFEEIFAKKR